MSNTIKIKKGNYFKSESIIENANGDLLITDPDGSVFDLVPKQQTRQTFSNDLLTVSVFDALLENYFWSITNELKDGVTVEVDSSGTVTLTGASGSVDGITVNGVEIMSGAVNFITDLTITALAVAGNINAFQSKYEAIAVAGEITITDVESFNDTDSNGFVIVSTTTTLVGTDVDMSGGITAIISDVDTQTDYVAVRDYLSAFVGKV